MITGTPDHDDIVLVNNKLNEVVENNKQFTTYSDIFKAIFENQILNGTYLVTFDRNIKIDNVTYDNLNETNFNYIKKFIC